MNTIDARLTHNAALITKLSLCSLYLKNNADFLWFVLIPEGVQVTEIFELSFEQRSLLIEEIAACSALIAKNSKADKINTAAIGNIVSQLHIHIVARFREDLAWPFSIWQPMQENIFTITQFNEQVIIWQQKFAIAR